MTLQLWGLSGGGHYDGGNVHSQVCKEKTEGTLHDSNISNLSPGTLHFGGV